MNDADDHIATMRKLILWGKVSASLMTATLTYNIVMLYQAIAVGNLVAIQIHMFLTIFCVAMWCWNLFG